MPKRDKSSSTPLHERRSARRRLLPPATYYGSGSPVDPIVVVDEAHTGGNVVDGGLYPPVVGLPIQTTAPTQADLDEQCIIIADEVPSPSPIRPYCFLRDEIRSLLDEARASVDAWPDDGQFIRDVDVHHCTPTQIRIATQIARNFVVEPIQSMGMTALQALLLYEDNFPVEEHVAVMCVRRMRGRELRRIPSDLTSLTLRSQDSTRSGGTEEYKRAEPEDTDDDVV